MTQAPTPGPLSGDDWTAHDGGECPFEHGTIIDVRYGDGEEQKSVTLHKGHGSWAYGPDGIHETDVAAYRIVSAPTAPVEASGSEQLWPVGSWLSAALDDPKVCDAMKSDIRDWFENGGHLRPQPSGETREAVARVLEPWGPPQPGRGPVTVRRWEDALAKADAILALLSALALGGQHSTATDFPADDVLACVDDTTPARAEAQDEGAAVLKGVGKINGDGWKDTTTEGEIVFVWNAEKPTPYAPGQYPRVGNEGWSASTSQYDFTPATADDVPAVLAALARAHPSPTPAADADRVRIAVEALESFAREAEGWPAPTWTDEKTVTAFRNLIVVGHLRRAAEAFAALKSTAAKEGGEV